MRHSARDGQINMFQTLIDGYIWRSGGYTPLTERKSWGMKPPLAFVEPEVVVMVPSEALGEVRMRLDTDMKGKACSPRAEWEYDDRAGSGWDAP